MIGTPGALDRYVPPSVFALTGGAPLRSGRASAAEHEEVVRDHAEAHPAMHPIQAAVATAGESMAVLQNTDSALAPGPPAKRAAEPAGTRLAPATRQHHSAHPAGLRGELVGARTETPVGNREAWWLSKELFV